MIEVILKTIYVINDLIQIRLKHIHVTNLTKKGQEFGVDCIEYIQNWSINRLIWSTK
jgi:hypothetical protein